MRTLFVSLLLLIAPAFGGDEQFNGRWDIRVINEPRNRAWWLEVNGAGTGALKGRFVGFPGGNMNDIPEMSIGGGELTFKWDRNNNHQVYRARLHGDKLEGNFESGKQKLEWIGVRAPVLPDKDDGSWRAGKPVKLFDGKSLAGWQAMVAGQPLGWTVKDGIMGNTPAANNGALYSRILPTENASRPPGEWQTLDIRLVGRQVSVTLNGKKIIVKQEVEGLTAMASDPNEGEPGPITLQGDHRNVEFRSLVVTPLVK